MTPRRHGRNSEAQLGWHVLTIVTARQVREMRLVRREDARGVCLVLLRFCDAETAAGFYDNYNGRPVRLSSSAARPGR